MIREGNPYTKRPPEYDLSSSTTVIYITQTVSALVKHPRELLNHLRPTYGDFGRETNERVLTYRYLRQVRMTATSTGTSQTLHIPRYVFLLPFTRRYHMLTRPILLPPSRCTVQQLDSARFRAGLEVCPTFYRAGGWTPLGGACCQRLSASFARLTCPVPHSDALQVHPRDPYIRDVRNAHRHGGVGQQMGACLSLIWCIGG